MSHGNKSSHEDNRKKVCGPCGKKIKFGSKKPEKFLISENTEKLIQKYISKDFDLKNEKFPLSICVTCSLTLHDAEKKNFQRPFQEMPNYLDVFLPKNTRSSQETCNCYICLTGRYKGHAKIDKGRGHKRDFQNEIDVFTGLYGASKIDSLSVSTIEAEPTPNLMCSNCFQEIKGRGIGHTCKTNKNNLLKIVENLPEKHQDKIVSTIIKKKVESSNAVTKKSVNVDFNLSTSGHASRIVLNPSIKKSVSFDEESLDNFRTNLAVSGNQMKKITNFVRCKVGRKSIPPYYAKHSSDKLKVLDPIYKHGVYYFDCENDSSKTKQPRPVVYADAEELFKAVIEERNIVGNIIVKVLADGGQRFFKISLTILPEDYSPTDDNENNKSDFDEPNESSSKRKLSSQGGSVSKKGKLTSVNRLILLCVVPQIKETYDNVKLLFELTKINNIPFKFVSDFKFLLIAIGQQTASAMYPCPYCFVTLDDLKKNPYCKHLSASTSANSTDDLETENEIQLKTFGDLRADYEKFRSSGSKKKFSKECRSTVNLPLFDEADDVYVLQKCVIPELHILQGLVNHLFWQGLVPLLGEEKALLWPKKLNVISKNYHGDAFEGNACRKLLKEADKLNDNQIYEKVDIFKIVPYIAAYKAMNKVVDCCFTSGKIGSSLDSHISELGKALQSIENLSEPLKIHVILAHVKESLKYIENGFGLGFWSEQSGEAVHRDFLKTWQSYKINDVYDVSYASRLQKAVTQYSSSHL